MALDLEAFIKGNSPKKPNSPKRPKEYLRYPPTGLLLWGLLPLPVVFVGGSEAPWLFVAAWILGALVSFVARQWLVRLHGGGDAVADTQGEKGEKVGKDDMEESGETVDDVKQNPLDWKFLVLVLFSVFLLVLFIAVLWLLEFEFPGFVPVILGGLWVIFAKESQEIASFLNEIWETLTRVRKNKEQRGKFVERFKQAWSGDENNEAENREEWKLFSIVRKIVLMLFILWTFIVVLFSVSNSESVNVSLFILGILAASVGFILMKYTDEDRFGLTSFVLALCISGWFVLVRDNRLDAEFGFDEEGVALWVLPGENYFAVLALSATAFTLLLAFRITRISTYTSEEEQLVYKLLARFDQIDRDTKNNLLKKLVAAKIDIIEKLESTSFKPNIESKENIELYEVVRNLRGTNRFIQLIDSLMP